MVAFVLFVLCAAGLYFGVAMLTFALRHADLTDTQRFLCMTQALTFADLAPGECQ